MSIEQVSRSTSPEQRAAPRWGKRPCDGRLNSIWRIVLPFSLSPSLSRARRGRLRGCRDASARASSPTHDQNVMIIQPDVSIEMHNAGVLSPRAGVNKLGRNDPLRPPNSIECSRRSGSVRVWGSSRRLEARRRGAALRSKTFTGGRSSCRLIASFREQALLF